MKKIIKQWKSSGIIFTAVLLAAITLNTVHTQPVFGKIPFLKKEQSQEYANKLFLPEVQSFTLKNGLKIMYIKSDLPQFTMMVSTGFGQLYENKTNAGIAELLAKVISLGGSKKYPGGKLHMAVEEIGGRFALGSSWEETTVSVRMLERYSDIAFDIIKDILENPNFSRDAMDNAKSILAEEIRRRKDHPASLAFEKAREIIFGGMGYGARADEKKIMKLEKAYLLDTWKKFFTAGNTIIAISSSLGFNEIKKKAERSFSSLRPGKREYYTVDKDKVIANVRKNANKIFLIHRSIPQSTIVMGTLAPRISDPDNYNLEVMNYILGGGSFNSRMMKEIRVKRGLSYAVQSVVRLRKKTGVFLAYAQTNTLQADRTYKLMLETINSMKSGKVTDEELDWAKNSIINSYIFEFETPLEVLDRLAYIYYNQLPYAYLLKYQGRISSVNSAMVRKASEGLLKNGMVKVIVGDRSLKEKLSTFGEVVVIEP